MNRFSLKFLFVVVAMVAIVCWLIRMADPSATLYTVLLVTACGGGMALAKNRRSLAALSGCVLLIIWILGFEMISMSGHPVPLDRLNRIQPGTTKAKVQSLLGAPTRIRRRGRAWIYSGTTWCNVTIRFTTDGKVDYVDHDHQRR